MNLIGEAAGVLAIFALIAAAPLGDLNLVILAVILVGLHVAIKELA